jgi:hypothetical protein
MKFFLDMATSVRSVITIRPGGSGPRSPNRASRNAPQAVAASRSTPSGRSAGGHWSWWIKAMLFIAAGMAIHDVVLRMGHRRIDWVNGNNPTGDREGPSDNGSPRWAAPCNRFPTAASWPPERRIGSLSYGKRHNPHSPVPPRVR